MARALHPNTGLSRRLVLTDKGRRALELDRLGIDLPASYQAWGAADSPVCENGHPRVPQNRRRSGGCQKCVQIGTRKRRRAVA
jgi:hypothetical protein